LRRLALPALTERSHVAGRAHAALEQPGLVVEAVRVDAAVGLPETHDEAPALPGADREHALLHGKTVGRQRDAARHPGRRRFDVEIEANAALEGLRQAGDDAGHRDVL